MATTTAMIENAFTKVVRVGRTTDVGNLFCKITYSMGKLSITGVEGPMRNGNAKGGCGQIVMSDWHLADYAPDWDADKVAQFRAAWDAWHLNDVTAGSPAQMAHLKANPVTDRLNYFSAACASLEAAGLQPDAGYLHNGKPYSYGFAWLRVEVPEDVIAFLRSLPDADVAPAWV